MHVIEPDTFDLIVVGSGLVESIVAAAASKTGKTVLQVDPADHYGGAWASLHLDEFVAAVEAQPEVETTNACVIPSDVDVRVQKGRIMRYEGAQLGSSTAYNIDVSPHLLYGAGPMISLLIGSGAHHYTEYKLLQGVFVSNSQGDFQLVPSTRAEIFRDRTLSPLQKRTLMRFLKASSEAMQAQGPLKESFDERPLTDLLTQEGLDEDLQHRFIHGVLLYPTFSGVSAKDALKRLELYAESVGRYGPDAGPFLVPMYGCGELSQAFCRAAAVSGAVQVLRCGLRGLLFDELTNACTGIELENGQRVQCSHLATGLNGACRIQEEGFQLQQATVMKRIVHRCVAILDAPLLSEQQHALVAVPSTEGPGRGHVVWGLQLGSSTAVSPAGKWLLHLWTENSGDMGCDAEDKISSGMDAESLLLPTLMKLVDCSCLSGGGDASHVEKCVPMSVKKPGVQSNNAVALLAAFFSVNAEKINVQGQSPGRGSWPPNVMLCPGPAGAVAMADVVDTAKNCYWALFPPQCDNEKSKGESGADAMLENFPLEPASTTGTAGGGAGGEGYDSDDETVMALQAALQTPHEKEYNKE